MPLTRILVATDHSATAQRAAEFAGTLAGPGYRLEITLLSVHPELPRPVGRSGRATAQARPYAGLHDPTWHQVPVGLVEEHLLPVVEAARARRLRRVVV